MEAINIIKLAPLLCESDFALLVVLSVLPVGTGSEETLENVSGDRGVPSGLPLFPERRDFRSRRIFSKMALRPCPRCLVQFLMTRTSSSACPDGRTLALENLYNSHVLKQSPNHQIDTWLLERSPN